jgi:hypothetical protein
VTLGKRDLDSCGRSGVERFRHVLAAAVTLKPE